MPASNSLRLYAVIKAPTDSRKDYDESFSSLKTYTQRILREEPYISFSTRELVEGFRVVGTPAKHWKAEFVGDDEYPDLDPSRKPPAELIRDGLLIVYEFDTPSLLHQFLNVVRRGQTVNRDAPIFRVGVDLGVGSTDHWCPASNLDTFGTRADARQIVAANDLPGSLRGKRVNVVIIDEGLHKASIPPKNWGGGLSWVPPTPAPSIPAGSAERTSHGMMIARTILDLAPDAVLFDVPLIPPRITADFFSGLSSADAVYERLLLEIWIRRPFPRWAGPWIFVNAWAIFDRSIETPPGDYTENRNPLGHPLIEQVKNAIRLFDFDVIFAAGNCGEFCGSPRCGGVDRGPGRSIWGANALPEVITTSAVLVNDMWAGYSSQGPGPNINGLARDKPDLCAPSNFRETNDAAVHNSGTSTACAMTAGIVAALRSKPDWDQRYVPPATMHRALTRSARYTQGAGWNGRLGHGILNALAAMDELP